MNKRSKVVENSSLNEKNYVKKLKKKIENFSLNMDEDEYNLKTNKNNEPLLFCNNSLSDNNEKKKTLQNNKEQSQNKK